MMHYVKWSAILLLILSASPVRADQGPLQLKNRFPLHLLFLTPRPLPSRTPAGGNQETSLALDYSPVYFSHSNQDWDFLIDLEMTTADLSFRYGLTSRMAVKVDLPFVSLNAGFLDRFLEGYHDTLGVANYGRQERPDNAFAYRVSHKGRTWIDAPAGTFELADLTLSAQWQALGGSNAQTWAGSLVLSLKVPSGNADHGMGSGQFDYGLFATADRRVGPLSFYLMTGVAVNHDPDTLGARIRTRPSYAWFGAIGYHYSDRATWWVQVNAYTSPIEETGISEVDQPAAELGLGLHYLVDRNWQIEFAFGEDLTRAAPDFTVRIGLAWKYQIGKTGVQE